MGLKLMKKICRNTFSAEPMGVGVRYFYYICDITRLLSSASSERPQLMKSLSMLDTQIPTLSAGQGEGSGFILTQFTIQFTIHFPTPFTTSFPKPSSMSIPFERISSLLAAAEFYQQKTQLMLAMIDRANEAGQSLPDLMLALMSIDYGQNPSGHAATIASEQAMQHRSKKAVERNQRYLLRKEHGLTQPKRRKMFKGTAEQEETLRSRLAEIGALEEPRQSTNPQSITLAELQELGIEPLQGDVNYQEVARLTKAQPRQEFQNGFVVVKPQQPNPSTEFPDKNPHDPSAETEPGTELEF